MGIISRTVRVSQNTRHQPGHRVDQHERGKFPAGQHEISDRYLVSYQVFTNTFVNPFVAPTKKGKVGDLDEFLSHSLRENPSLRCQHDHRAGGWCAQHRFDCRKDGFNLHDHAAPSTIRKVISDMVAVNCPVTYIVNSHL